MPFLVMIPHLLLIFYPVQECEAKIEPLSRIKSDELCHSQDEMTKLRGVNIDILCPGDLVQCMCHVRSKDNNELIRLIRPGYNFGNKIIFCSKVQGRREHQLCICNNVGITLHQVSNKKEERNSFNTFRFLSQEQFVAQVQGQE